MSKKKTISKETKSGPKVGANQAIIPKLTDQQVAWLMQENTDLKLMVAEKEMIIRKLQFDLQSLQNQTKQGG